MGFLCDLLRVSLRRWLLPQTILVFLMLTFRSCCQCHCVCVRHVCVDEKMSVLCGSIRLSRRSGTGFFVVEKVGVCGFLDFALVGE